MKCLQKNVWFYTQVVGKDPFFFLLDVNGGQGRRARRITSSLDEILWDPSRLSVRPSFLPSRQKSSLSLPLTKGGERERERERSFSFTLTLSSHQCKSVEANVTRFPDFNYSADEVRRRRRRRQRLRRRRRLEKSHKFSSC